ncbi:hypothetical protein [Bradyrhizobium ottawaense]|uniref:hypothetical protein n=1 Tax=Bradyrhizobium ottawaense TaxID=931866 RepID=UPI003513A03A
MGKHVHHVLAQLGYRLIEDAWAEGGRRSYVSNEDADRDLLKDLQTLLADYGWTKHPNILRAFINARLVELLEIEIGGRETGGHLLHHLKVAPPRF